MPNRLASESSPYLQQHAHNPVDWYPWGPEALARARAEDRPILLSIGYAACHWCHVMERESFEDAETAALMNRLYVNVKVDREERPDLDAIYMQAVQAMTGHGGWPMTVFLTPAGEPFYGGTYYPPEDRHGMPSFRRILQAVGDAWRDRRDGVAATARSMRDIYEAAHAPARAQTPLSAPLLERAYRSIVKQADLAHGGFGAAPKFPQAMALDFALRHWRRTGTEWTLELVTKAFRAMARGGIHDQVGGGFARYAVDAKWLVPHFEKMLYDNALLARLGVHLWQATGDDEARRVTRETLAWVAREMTAPSGGFYSSLDADSEGEEGKFYLWDETELDALLGEDAAIVKAHWGVSAAGNFEGRNILHVAQDAALVARRQQVDDARVEAAIARAKRLLLAARERRVRPGRDEKILAAWNGLMLRAVALAARAFGDAALRELAVRNGQFLLREMVRDDRARRSHKDGATSAVGFLDDQASVALGFLALWELTFDRRWLDAARRLADAMIAWFWDDATQHFYDTPADHEALVTRPREVTDNAVPSGTSLATELLLHLAELLHDVDHRRRATFVLETLAEPMAVHGPAFGHLLGVADMVVHGAVEVALVGTPGAPDFERLADAAFARYVPSLVVAGGPPDALPDVALLADRPLQGGRATAYVCRSYTCEAPATDESTLLAQLEAASRAATPS